jgi:hypothetical protein
MPKATRHSTCKAISFLQLDSVNMVDLGSVVHFDTANSTYGDDEISGVWKDDQRGRMMERAESTSQEGGS